MMMDQAAQARSNARGFQRVCSLGLGSFLVLALLGACGGEGGTTADDGLTPQECVADLVELTDGDISAAELVERCEVSAAEAEAAVPAAVAEAEPEPPATTEVEEAAPTTEPAPAPAAPPAEPAALMPDIPCGTDLQLAQDTVQEAGPWKSRSVDATGQDRFQVIDRNWVVVRSEPPPGTPIDEDDAVFYVVKDEEFTGC